VNAYLDSSVLLRIALGQPKSLVEWNDIEQFVASALLVVECFRVADRLRLTNHLTDEETAQHHEMLRSAMKRIAIIDLTRPVLDRAAQSFPVPVKTLDALHLSTAILWRESEDPKLLFATHDSTLALAARAFGFRVMGA
jgi:predicted nucleic acid-binding protein